MAIHHPNAVIFYFDEDDIQRTQELWVMDIYQTYGMAGSTSKAKYYQHWYPMNFSMGPMTIKGRVRTQTDYNNLAEFIRRHQRLMASESGQTNVKGDSQDDLHFMRLEIKSEAIYVDGFIKSFKADHHRFNVAPEFEFNFEVMRDGFQDVVTGDANVSQALHDAWFIGVNLIPGELTISDVADTTILPPSQQQGHQLDPEL